MTPTENISEIIRAFEPQNKHLKNEDFTINELDLYKLVVERLAKSKSDFLFPNSNNYHAAIVLTTIVRHTDKTLRIYDDALDGDISGEYDCYQQLLPLFEQHVRLGKNLQIVVRDGSPKESSIFFILKELSSQFKKKFISPNCFRKL